ncbi:APC family permease [Mycobacterium tilburgii]|uniref:APC family permease n=1 Tax=Mycobacterium tilburgii TaxID=44467 RepID=UPI0016435C29|nr:amino acid permease [Mycobacterium tilburgii]
MGEEVRDPARTIPRAITTALAIAVVLYAAIGVSALLAIGPDRLARATAPLAEAVRAVGHPGLVPVISTGAALASLGVLLALIAGLGRTMLAMARHRDLPGWPPYTRGTGCPHHAEIAVGVAVCALVSTVDLRGVISCSSFGALIYYAIANAAALTLRQRGAVNVCGLAGCLVLVATLPWESAVAGLTVFVVGVAGRAVILAARR